MDWLYWRLLDNLHEKFKLIQSKVVLKTESEKYRVAEPERYNFNQN